MTRNKTMLRPVKHLLIGGALLLKGIDKVSHHAFIGSIILVFGIIILGYFFYELFTRRPSDRLTNLVHWFEAVASLFTAYIFFTEGATYLPYMFLLAAIGFFIAIYIHHKKANAHQAGH